MRFFRLSPPCLLVWVVLLTVGYIAGMFTFWVIRPRSSSTTAAGGNFLYTCNMTDDYRNKLELLLEKVHQILDQNQLEHFLCYGTLWGQIRMSALLPWASRAHLCVFHDQFAAINEGILYSSFQHEFIQLTHSAAEDVYTVQRNHHVLPVVELHAFVRDDEQNVYKRSGWRRRLLPPHCDWTPALDCFPAHLMQRPLPMQRLGRFEYPVPMGGIEMQKYHYADNWWKTITTRNCNSPADIIV